jgi:hypothetical protein
MFEDSFSEGHVYWGRVAVVMSGVIALAFTAAQFIH